MFSNIDKTYTPDDEKLLAALSAIAAVVAAASAVAPRQMNVLPVT